MSYDIDGPDQQFLKLIPLLKSGTVADWESVPLVIKDFPNGCDSIGGRRWIINAIDCGSVECVQWMLGKGVDLNFRDEEGHTPLHAAIDREEPRKYEILEMLLAAGAPVNLKGWNDWTPAHQAAARDDVEALKLLVRFGADLSIRTEIDDCGTPLEEAQALGKANAAEFLKNVI